MITPRRTRLVRVADLQIYRRAITGLTEGAGGSGLGAQGLGLRAHADALVVVPTRGAARLLQRNVSAEADVVTRDELYDRLHSRLADPPRRLSALERDVMAQAAARASAARGELSFRLRPGLMSVGAALCRVGIWAFSRFAVVSRST